MHVIQASKYVINNLINCFSFSGLFIDVVRNSIVTSLEVGAFFLQFMNSWNIKKLNYDMRDLPNVSAPTVSLINYFMNSK